MNNKAFYKLLKGILYRLNPNYPQYAIDVKFKFKI